MLIIFDLDGVLLDNKDLHFNSLNTALSKLDPRYMISIQEHLILYDGLPTMEKLHKLTALKNLPQQQHQFVHQEKQLEFQRLVGTLSVNPALLEIFSTLKNSNYQIAVASNSIRSTVELCLEKLNLLHYVDFVASNQDVRRPKPCPDMFWLCMTELNELPATTLIIEDSPVGRTAAAHSGATVMAVRNSKDVTLTAIQQHLDLIQTPRTAWRDNKLNILIPMAGLGSRFAAAGYTFPKPLIDLQGRSMIQRVVENLNIDAHYIFLVQRSHFEQYDLGSMLTTVRPGCTIVLVDGLTEGAACTSLLAKQYIDNQEPLLIVNSDQFIEWDSTEFMYSVYNSDCDAVILTFESADPKWSYALADQNQIVQAVAEKDVISSNATVGIYFWQHGADYVTHAESMIRKNIRTNNEFYICPVFNEAIAQGLVVTHKRIKRMWGLGTPEDLNYFLSNYKL